MNQLQPIFLIGSMKSGTSSIFKHLELHPEICFPPIKEPEFFSINMGKPEFKNGEFWDLFEIKNNHKFVFDGSTGYTKFPAERGVPKRIFDYGLKPKFIYVVRNPFDRIQSHYNFMQKDLKWKAEIISDHLINVSNYYLQLKQYEEYFDKKDFYIVDFDDLLNDYKSVMKNIYSFIGTKNYVISENEIRNNITKPVNRNELKLKNKLGGKFNFLPRNLRKQGKIILNKLLTKQKKQLSRKQKDIIYNQLESDMILFEKKYNFPISKWGFKTK